MGFLAHIFGFRKNHPETVIIREVDVESKEFKDDPWDVPWEGELGNANNKE